MTARSFKTRPNPKKVFLGPLKLKGRLAFSLNDEFTSPKRQRMAAYVSVELYTRMVAFAECDHTAIITAVQ